MVKNLTNQQIQKQININLHELKLAKNINKDQKNDDNTTLYTRVSDAKNTLEKIINLSVRDESSYTADDKNLLQNVANQQFKELLEAMQIAENQDIFDAKDISQDLFTKINKHTTKLQALDMSRILIDVENQYKKLTSKAEFIEFEKQKNDIAKQQKSIEQQFLTKLDELNKEFCDIDD